MPNLNLLLAEKFCIASAADVASSLSNLSIKFHRHKKSGECILLIPFGQLWQRRPNLSSIIMVLVMTFMKLNHWHVPLRIVSNHFPRTKYLRCKSGKKSPRSRNFETSMRTWQRTRVKRKSTSCTIN